MQGDETTQDDGRQIAKRAAIWLVGFAFLFVFWNASGVFFVLFAGLLLAVVFSGLADALDPYFPGPRGVALIFVCVVIIAIVMGVISLAGTALVLEFEQVVAAAKSGLAMLNEKLNASGLGEVAAGSGRIFDIVAGNGTTLASTFVAGFSNLLFILFIAAFIAWDPGLYRRGLLSLLPREKREEVDHAVLEAAERLKQWLKGQGLAMLTVFAATWLILWLIGMPYAFALAVQAGLLAFIQTVGPAISGLFIVAAGLSVSGTMALYGLGAYALIQLIESNLTTPLIQRHVAAIPPALSLFAQLLFGALFGFLALILAVPILAVALTMIGRLYVKDALGGEMDEAKDKRIKEEHSD